MQMNPRDITRADALRFLAPYQGKFCVCSSLAISVFFQVLFGDEVAVRFVVAERYSAARRVNFELETHFVQGARARVNLTHLWLLSLQSFALVDHHTALMSSSQIPRIRCVSRDRGQLLLI